MQEQCIGCLRCGTTEVIRQDSPRLIVGVWPAWTPGLQTFGCPACGSNLVWATEPRDVSPPTQEIKH